MSVCLVFGWNLGILSTVTFTCHIYSLFTAGITKGPRDQSVCELLPDYYRFMHIVNLMDTVVTLIIPLVLIVLMNTLIAKNLIVFSRTFKKPRSPSSSHLNSIQVFIRLIEFGVFFLHLKQKKPDPQREMNRINLNWLIFVVLNYLPYLVADAGDFFLMFDIWSQASS